MRVVDYRISKGARVLYKRHCLLRSAPVVMVKLNDADVMNSLKCCSNIMDITATTQPMLLLLLLLLWHLAPILCDSIDC